MDKYKNYLEDNMILIRNKIEELKLAHNIDEFTKGQLITYYDVITIFKEQAVVFDIELKEIGLDTFDENSILF